MEGRFPHVIHSNEARNEAPSSAVHQRQTTRTCGLAAVIGRTPTQDSGQGRAGRGESQEIYYSGRNEEPALVPAQRSAPQVIEMPFANLGDSTWFAGRFANVGEIEN
jgi:hypothetical protein